MRLGIDFDNTLVQYDEVFHRIAFEHDLIPRNLPANKTRIRDYIHQNSSRDAWTELQGVVYGEAIAQAKPYQAAIETLIQCRTQGVTIILISHKTQSPVLGPRRNLHRAAYQWLADQELYSANAAGNLLDEVWFEETRAAKYHRIAAQRCDYFLDDLQDFLLDPEFPKSTHPIWFAPALSSESQASLTGVTSWAELPGLLTSFA